MRSAPLSHGRWREPGWAVDSSRDSLHRTRSTMSDDEFVIAVTSGILAVAYWGGWLAIATGTNRLARPAWRVAAVICTVLGSLAVVFVALVTGADPQVRSSAGYVVLFLAVAAD